MPNKTLRDEILQALARGYCTKRNKDKALDPDLLEDLADSLLKLLKERAVKKAKIAELIPEVYCDVYPLCNQAVGYTQDGTSYKLQLERGGDLVDALSQQFLILEVWRSKK